MFIKYSEEGIYKRKEESKKERKHSLDQESKIQEKTITIKKKEGRKWKTQIRIKHLASFFYSISSNRQIIDTIISGSK